MMKASSQNIVLADSSKFGQRGFGRICALEDIDVIITDDVSVKLPKLSSGETILFACEDGRLSADNPRQGKLSFAKVEVKEPANDGAGKFEKLK